MQKASEIVMEILNKKRYAPKKTKKLNLVKE